MNSEQNRGTDIQFANGNNNNNRSDINKKNQKQNNHRFANWIFHGGV